MSLGTATVTFAGLALVAYAFEKQQRARPSKSLKKVRIPSIYRLGPEARPPRCPFPLLSPHLLNGITKQRRRGSSGPVRRVSTYESSAEGRTLRSPHTAHYKRSDGRPCYGNARLEHDIRVDPRAQNLLVAVADALEEYKQFDPALRSRSSAGSLESDDFVVRRRSGSPNGRAMPLRATEVPSSPSQPIEPRPSWSLLQPAPRNVSRPKTPHSPGWRCGSARVNAQYRNRDSTAGAVGPGDQAAVNLLRAKLGSGFTDNATVCDADTNIQNTHQPWRIVSQAQLLDLIPWTNKERVEKENLIPENFYTTFNVVAAFLKQIADHNPTDDMIVDEILGFGCLMDYPWVDVEYMVPEYPTEFWTDSQREYWTAHKEWKEIALCDLGVEINEHGEFVTESEKFFEEQGWEMQVPLGMKKDGSNGKK